MERRNKTCYINFFCVTSSRSTMFLIHFCNFNYLLSVENSTLSFDSFISFLDLILELINSFLLVKDRIFFKT